MGLLFFRHAQDALEQQRGKAYAGLYLAVACDDTAAVSRQSRAVQAADDALAALAERRKTLLAAQRAATEGQEVNLLDYDRPLSLYDMALEVARSG